jgi:hypothetical protein
MSPMRLGTKNHSVDKDQQQFSSQSTRQLFRGLYDPQSHETVEYGHESRRNLPYQSASQTDSVSLCVCVCVCIGDGKLVRARPSQLH